MPYNVGSKDVETEQEINKSRFISYLFRHEDAGACKEDIANLRRKHPKAAHVAYAYYLGKQEAPVCVSSDDGEPKGTAGRPILEAILEKNAHNLLIAVVRYFGGIKLGSGGLTRAYHSSAVNALALAGLRPDIEYKRLTVRADYENFEKLKRYCVENNYKIINEVFTEDVSLELEHEADIGPDFPYGLIKLE